MKLTDKKLKISFRTRFYVFMTRKYSKAGNVCQYLSGRYLFPSIAFAAFSFVDLLA